MAEVLPLDLRGSDTAIVLGAGGQVGHAFHAGVLAALHDHAGFDARTARLIVGTSAGAGIGALLRASLGGVELLARVLGHPLPEWAQSVASCFRRPDHRTPEPRERRYRPAAPHYLWHAARRPWSVRAGSLAAALLPAGRVALDDYASGLRQMFAAPWPESDEHELWIPAMRLRDGKVVVFGHPEGPRVDVGTAVACSSAVPSVCAPVVVDGEAYVDGGLISALNLRCVESHLHIKTVIVSSPLSRMPLMSRWMRAEARRLRSHGIDVIAIEPGASVVGAMGWNPFSVERAPAVALAAYEEMQRRIVAAQPSNTFEIAEVV